MPSTPSNDLEKRLRHVEDMQAIYQLISAYGPSADSCNWQEIKRIWKEDSTYDVGGRGLFQGHTALKGEFDNDFHQGIVKDGSAHASTMPHVVIEGDRATATHYGTLYTCRHGQFILIRLTASRWLLERTPDLGWRVKRRTNRLLNGDPAARKILSEVREGPSEVDESTS